MFPLTRDRSRNRSAIGFRPSLILNFGQDSNDILDPRITFSRASNATLVNSAGAVAYAPHNLLTFSESMDNSAWSKARATVSANTTAAPDGTTTADSLIEDTTASNSHYAAQNFSFVSGFSYTYSLYAKGNTRTRVGILAFNTGSVFTASTAVFNLTTGIITRQDAGFSSASIADVGNGWFRVSVTIAAQATATGAFGIMLANSDTSVTYTGDGTSGLFIWGAQLNVGALQPYYCTTVENALGFTQEFNNAAWTKTRSTVTANATAAPDGYVTADKLVEDTTASNTHFTAQSRTGSNETVTASVYAKAGERSRFKLEMSNFATASCGAFFDVSTGVVVAVDAPNADYTNPSATITAVGNGWYRCKLTVTKGAVNTTNNFVMLLVSTGTTISYTGDGTSGVFIWGAQLSDSASLDPYVYNPAAAFTSTAYYGPRFDYDPVTLAPRGLLIEEQRTNSIRNNSMVGAVAGTPGTQPTNWVVSTGAGITRQLVGVGVEDGINYIDYRFSGTGSVVSDTQFDVGNFIAATSGQAWTHSAYCRIVGGSLSNITVTQIVAENSAAGAFLAASSQNITPTSSALGTQRYALTRTLNNASTAFVIATLRVTSAGAIDVTVRIGLPQLELGAFATSVIPTTTAAATRAADVATMVGDNFSNWYNQSEGTLFADATPQASTAGGYALIEAGDGTASNRIGLFKLITSGNASLAVLNGGATQASTNNGAWTATGKLAGAYKLDDFASSFNGGSVATDTSGTVPVVNQLTLGRRQDGPNVLNGHLRRVAYFNRRLSNSELQAVTA